MSNKYVEKASKLARPFSADDVVIIRQSFDMSRTDFAKNVLQVPYSTVEKWERGSNSINAAAQSLYALVLHARKKEYFPCILDWICADLDHDAG